MNMEVKKVPAPVRQRFEADMQKRMSDFIEGAPKIENHVHLDGSYDFDLVFEMMKKYTDELPEKVIAPVINREIPSRKLAHEIQTIDEMKKYVCCPDDCADLFEFLAPFSFFLPIVAVGLKHDVSYIEKIAYAFVKRQKESNVIYSEVRYSPQLMLAENDVICEEVKSAEEKKAERFERLKIVVETVAKGFQRGEKDFGVRCNQILCCLCFNPEWSPEVKELVQHFNSMDYKDCAGQVSLIY